MLTVIVGGTVESRQKKRDTVLASFSNSIVHHFSDEGMNPEEIGVILGSTSLFGDIHVIICDRMLGSNALGLYLEEHAGELHAASHQVVIIEEALTAPRTKLFVKAGATMHELETPTKKQPAKEFNIFGLTDACLARDRKAAWVILMDARMHDAVPAEIIGVLFWMIKSLFLVATVTDASILADAGLKPFVISKNKRFVSKWKRDEIVGFMRILVQNGHALRYQHESEAWGVLEQIVLNHL